jgi:hypothetical protein
MREGLLGSVIIPAHDEAPVIDRCLSGLLEGMLPDALDVVVVCNGCTDDTAVRARCGGPGVTVIEIPEASKTAALRAGDLAARAFPRLYIDADVIVPGASAAETLRRLAGDEVLAARPALRYDTDGCSPWVRRYYAARVKMPQLMCRLWGAGVFGVSAAGHTRIGLWPDGIADDLYADSLFTDDEIEIVDVPPVVVAVPRTARALVAVLRRGARAKASHAEVRDDSGKPLPLRQSVISTLFALAQLIVREPRFGVDVVIYSGFSLVARLRDRRRYGVVWERDSSSRA